MGRQTTLVIVYLFLGGQWREKAVLKIEMRSQQWRREMERGREREGEGEGESKKEGKGREGKERKVKKRVLGSEMKQ